MKLLFKEGEFGDFLPFGVIVINPEKEVKMVTLKVKIGPGFSKEEGIKLAEQFLGTRIGTIENTDHEEET